MSIDGFPTWAKKIRARGYPPGIKGHLMSDLIVCTPKTLPRHQWEAAAAMACQINPANAPAIKNFSLASGFALEPEHIAVLTSAYWGTAGVKLSVSFLDNPPADLRARLLLHMNSWGAFSNVKFMETVGTGQVRIARAKGGYYSYLGTQILSIPGNQATMNLEAFTMQTPESEFHRVVRHETGHTLGFPHEHMRREIVARIDPAKAIAYFGRTQGWNRQTVMQQVLTPLEESSLMATPHADGTSVMTYQLDGSIMKDGIAVPGGTDIDPSDAEFAAKIYPPAGGPVQPPTPPPPPVSGLPPKAQADTLFATLATNHAAHPQRLKAVQLVKQMSDVLYQGGGHDTLDALVPTWLAILDTYLKS